VARPRTAARSKTKTATKSSSRTSGGRATAARASSAPASRTSRATAAKRTAASSFTCPECGNTFARAAALGAHRSRVHGVAGSSASAAAAKRRGRAASPGKRSRAASPAPSTARRRPINGAVERDLLLAALFPQGIPPREDVIRSVDAWLAEAERLAKLR
jgi:predicted RNA-binding Zn-ribbon protein involved in translation (DUF1610 family)